jgi:hypothetical protein
MRAGDILSIRPRDIRAIEAFLLKKIVTGFFYPDAEHLRTPLVMCQEVFSHPRIYSHAIRNGMMGYTMTQKMKIVRKIM